jgi:hypothetical protein
MTQKVSNNKAQGCRFLATLGKTKPKIPNPERVQHKGGMTSEKSKKSFVSLPGIASSIPKEWKPKTERLRTPSVLTQWFLNTIALMLTLTGFSQVFVSNNLTSVNPVRVEVQDKVTVLEIANPINVL